MSEAWIGLVGALGGVIVTGTFGLIVTVLKHRWDASAEIQQRKHRLSENQAGSRRSVYIRFLNAAEALGDHVLVQPPHKDGGAQDTEKAVERLRELQAGGDSFFSTYSSALLEAKLLAGAHVLTELVVFDEWMTDQLAIGLRVADAVAARAFFDAEEKRLPLLEAMRAEQAADLAT